MSNTTLSVSSPTSLLSLVRQVPGWENVDVPVFQPLGGGTNENFRFEVGGEFFVLRVSGHNTASIGINRRAELAALQRASFAGITPALIHDFGDEGHFITRFVAGTTWSFEDANHDENRPRAVDLLHRVHQLDSIEADFAPLRDVEHRLQQARELNIELPPDTADLLASAQRFYERFWCDTPASRGLCHGDAYANNYLDTTSELLLLDWEFAGMGDVYYDLNSISIMFTVEQKAAMLERYFGELPHNGLEKLAAIGCLALMWNWTWALLQIHLCGRREDHVNLEAALLNAMRHRLQQETQATYSSSGA